jgi:hypothetical protein
MSKKTIEVPIDQLQQLLKQNETQKELLNTAVNILVRIGDELGIKSPEKLNAVQQAALFTRLPFIVKRLSNDKELSAQIEKIIELSKNGSFTIELPGGANTTRAISTGEQQ